MEIPSCAKLIFALITGKTYIHVNLYCIKTDSLSSVHELVVATSVIVKCCAKTPPHIYGNSVSLIGK